MTFLFALLQTWHELDFNLGSPEDIEAFPWSVPVSFVIMVGLFFFLIKGRRNYMALPQLPASTGSQPLEATVVIPARNEEKDIGPCVKSFRNVRVIVVDDDSTDNTAAVAEAAGAEAIPAPPLPQGAMGKPNAMVAGEKLVTTDYVFFTDAQTRFQPEFLPSALQYAEENQHVLVSAFLKQECVTLFERMLVPYAFGLYFSGVSARRLQDVLARETLANGSAMLFLRSGHEFVGGYQSVQASPIEDVAIARKVKRHHMSLRITRAERMGRTRMYDSLGAIRRGLRRRAFRLLRANRLAGVQVIVTSILLTAILPVAVWMARQGQWPFVALLLLAPVVVFKPWYGGFGKALLYLPAIYLFQLIAIDGVVSGIFGLKMKWKGRKV